MGLIRAGLGALGGTLADQWKEFFYCDAIDNDYIMVKGQKRTGSRSSNTKGSDNIISNGSVIAVADGQAMAIVEQGKVVEFCAEPGEFTYDTSTEPSIFAGSLGTSILDTFKTIGKRFTFGGDTGKDQRVYYFNTKEIMGNKYGTATPIPFKVVINEQMGLKLSVDIRCNGEYTYKLTNPLLFYTNIAGNVTDAYEKSEWEDILRSSLLDALQPALASVAAQKIEYFELPGHRGNQKRSYRSSQARLDRNPRYRACKTYNQLAFYPRRSAQEDHRMGRKHDVHQRGYCKRTPCGCSGRCRKNCRRQRSRRGSGLYGHGHGNERRRRCSGGTKPL